MNTNDIYYKHNVKLQGQSHNQCGGCGLVFSSDTAFNTHRVGKFGNPQAEKEKDRISTRRCLTVEELLNHKEKFEIRKQEESTNPKTHNSWNEEYYFISPPEMTEEEKRRIKGIK